MTDEDLEYGTKIIGVIYLISVVIYLMTRIKVM